MKNEPGYPLPAGELGDDEIVCQLVFLPNKPEYWQALVSSLHYLATWRAWERDTDKRGKDAATNWSAAFEMTMECWRMACLDELQANVAAILAILETPNDCCGDSDTTGGDQYTDRVTDGEDDVPQNVIDSGYAEDVDDWEGFDDYKCMISHVLVDQIGYRLEGYLPWIDFGGKWLLAITIVAAFATIIATAGGAILAAGIVATTGTMAGLYWALFELGSIEDLIDDVATNYDELVCAIYISDGDEGALVALNDKIDELFSIPQALVLTNMNLGPTLKALYAGRYDQQDIAQNLVDAGYELDDFSCVCDIIELNGWTLYYNEDTTWDYDHGDPDCDQRDEDKWMTMQSPGGSPVSGTFRIKGYWTFTGELTKYGACSPQTTQIIINQAAEKSVSPTLPGVPSFSEVYDSGVDWPLGSQNIRVDFEWTGIPWSTVIYIHFYRRIRATFGEVVTDFDQVITQIEVT